MDEKPHIEIQQIIEAACRKAEKGTLDEANTWALIAIAKSLAIIAENMDDLVAGDAQVLTRAIVDDIDNTYSITPTGAERVK